MFKTHELLMGADPPYTCVSLFAGLGGFCQAFRGDRDWEVLAIDATDTFTRTATIDLDPYGIKTLDVTTTTTYDSYRVMDILDLEARDLPHPTRAAPSGIVVRPIL